MDAQDIQDRFHQILILSILYIHQNPTGGLAAKLLGCWELRDRQSGGQAWTAPWQ
jgi:hypothetical protein